jgi:hypothetical protein
MGRVAEVEPITPVVIDHRLHHLVWPCCSTSSCMVGDRHDDCVHPVHQQINRRRDRSAG